MENELEQPEETVTVKNASLWIAGGLLVAAGVAFWIGWQYQQKKKKKATAARTLQASIGGGTSGLCRHGDDFPLKKGSCGKNVTALQQKLIAEGFDLGDYGKRKDGVDGKYGADTEAAVQEALGRVTVTKADFQRL